MIARPRTHKLFTRNAGPFLVVRVQEPHVLLRSLTHGTTLKAHARNVRPLSIHL